MQLQYESRLKKNQSKDITASRTHGRKSSNDNRKTHVSKKKKNQKGPAENTIKTLGKRLRFSLASRQSENCDRDTHALTHSTYAHTHITI